jgi:hypothetical protein
MPRMPSEAKGVVDQEAAMTVTVPTAMLWILGTALALLGGGLVVILLFGLWVTRRRNELGEGEDR